MDKVSVRLKWKDAFQFAGYYVAKEKGFYSDLGLDVKILEYNGSNIVNDVLNGESTFGIGDSSLIRERAHGKPIVALSAIFQHSPLAIMTLKSSHITKIEQLKHKKIMATNAFFENPYIKLMFYTKNVNLENLRPHSFSSNIEELINKKVDAFAVYKTDQPYTLWLKKIQYNLISPKNYGIDFYSDILFTSEKELRTHPKQVKAFVEATLKGWRYAYAHLDESINIILKKYNTQHFTYEKLAFEANSMKDLLEINSKHFGKMNEDKINNISNIYTIAGDYIDKSTLDDFIYNLSNQDMNLSKDELDFLKSKKHIKMCVTSNWKPFEMIENGKFTGISSEYLKLIQKHIKTPIDLIKTDDWKQSLEYIKNKKCDIMPLALKTNKIEKNLDLTKPYIFAPLVIVTKLDKVFIENLNSIKSKKIGIVKGSPFIKYFKKNHPNMKFVEVESRKEGLNMVSHGKLYGLIDTLFAVGEDLQKSYYGELKIAGKLDEKLNLSIALRSDEPILLSILNKALSSITQEEKQDILNHWVSVKYDKGVDYKLLTYIGIFFFILLLLYVQRERTLKKYNMILKNKNKELEMLASTDVLTGILSRRSFFDIANQFIKVAKREKTPISFLMLDIDYFKNINDSYGHLVGDEVLKCFAKSISAILRKSDIFGRLGGEEFGILLNNTRKDIAHSLAERIRQEIKNQCLVIQKHKINFTVSIGIAMLEENDDIDKLVENADKALYISKERGRDKVT
ncbi:MAG: ABC transporter substrate-binding protein [Sulfurospirillaceae bacterium]|nr:ABC transporter substrate-binding protein [Sulfurospirillaceae bacterium]